MGARALAFCGVAAVLTAGPSARAQQTPPSTGASSPSPDTSSDPPPLPPDASIQFSTEPPEGKTLDETAASAESLAGPPPMRPRRKGVVLESELGVLGFAGQFRHVAPPAYWFRSQLGYEALRWLMFFGGAEVAFTDTNVSLDESQSMAFAMWGFDVGARATIHATERVAVYFEGEIGALTANVPHESLAILGFPKAEKLNPTYGGRLGVDWYQIDRHMALFASIGGRYASGFAKAIGPSDVPALWDAGGGLRYTF